MPLTWNEFRVKHKGQGISLQKLSSMYWSQRPVKMSSTCQGKSKSICKDDSNCAHVADKRGYDYCRQRPNARVCRGKPASKCKRSANCILVNTTKNKYCRKGSRTAAPNRSPKPKATPKELSVAPKELSVAPKELSVAPKAHRSVAKKAPTPPVSLIKQIQKHQPAPHRAANKETGLVGQILRQRFVDAFDEEYDHEIGHKCLYASRRIKAPKRNAKMQKACEDKTFNGKKICGWGRYRFVKGCHMLKPKQSK